MASHMLEGREAAKLILARLGIDFTRVIGVELVTKPGEMFHVQVKRLVTSEELEGILNEVEEKHFFVKQEKNNND